MFPPTQQKDRPIVQVINGCMPETVDFHDEITWPLVSWLDSRSRLAFAMDADNIPFSSGHADDLSIQWPPDADPSRIILIWTGPTPDERVPSLEYKPTTSACLSRNVPIDNTELVFCRIEPDPVEGTWLVVTNGTGLVEFFTYSPPYSATIITNTITNDALQIISTITTNWHLNAEPYAGMEAPWAYIGCTNSVDSVATFHAPPPADCEKLQFFAASIRTDTDADGLSDGIESFVSHSSPLEWDTDSDHLSDAYEYFVGLNPRSEDTDGNGIPDGDEADADGQPHRFSARISGVDLINVAPSQPGWNFGDTIGRDGSVTFTFENLHGTALWGTFDDGGHWKEPITISADNAHIVFTSEMARVQGQILWRQTACIMPDTPNCVFSVTVSDANMQPHVTDPNCLGADLDVRFDAFSPSILKLRERDAPCNQVPNPKQASDNSLFVSEEESGYFEIDADCNLEFLPKSPCATYLGVFSNTLLIAQFPLETPAAISLDIPSPEDESVWAIHFGIDINNDGILSFPEAFLPTLFTIDAIPSSVLASKKNALTAGANDWQVEMLYPVATSLLKFFLNSNAPPCNAGNITSSAVNCFNMPHLTHNAGADFDENGNAMIPFVHWHPEDTLSAEVGNSFALREKVSAIVSNHWAEVTNYFGQNASAKSTTMAWIAENDTIEFSLLDEPNANSSDMFFAFAHARLPLMRVQATIEKDTQGQISIEQIAFSGVLEDLYDFDCESYAPADSAARVQIGHDHSRPSRQGGQIFKIRVMFQNTFTID